MIPIQIDKKTYQIKNVWSEITIETAGKIMDLPVPESLLAVYQTDGGDETKKAMKKYSPELYKSYFMNVLEMLSDIPRDVLRRVDNLTVVYNSMVEHIVVDLLRMEPFSFQPLGIKQFKHRGEIYKLPTVDEMLNDERPFSDVDVARGLEALELNSHQTDIGGAGLPGLVGILARKNNEPFSDMTAIKQSKQFIDLPMSIFWEVFFCSKALSNGVLALTTTYSNRVQPGAENQVGKN